MYTFSPVVDMSDTHIGFYFFVIVAVIIVIFGVNAFLNDWYGREGAGKAFLHASWPMVVIIGPILVLAYKVSYTPDHPTNEQVIATFVNFQPEGYNELSGKTRADHHYMYVVYDVGGQRVVLRASEGVTYPKRAILYKN